VARNIIFMTHIKQRCCDLERTDLPEGISRYVKFLLTIRAINFMQRNRDNVGKRLQYVLQKGKTRQENELGAWRDRAERGIS